MFGLLGASCLAGQPAPSASAASAVTGVEDLEKLSPDELEQLYAGAPVGAQPVGYVRGRILFLANTRMPALKRRLAGVIWKGKVFGEDGEFVNQWADRRAVGSHTYVGASFHDGRECLILEYPENLIFFGNMRDEAREVAPGVYLCMVYERSFPFTFRGFIGLQLAPA